MGATERLDLWIGRHLKGRYRLDKLLGVGGMSKVYLAADEQEKSSQPLAIKVLLGSLVQDQEAQDRFQREILICSHLRDRRLVHVLDQGVTPPDWGPPQSVAHEAIDPDAVQCPESWPGSPYMVMEYIEGSTLYQELQRHPRLSVGRTLHLARHLVAGLRAAHVGVLIEGRLVRVVHRDLSPGNIYLVQDTYGRESIKLGDFGLARYVGEMDTEGLIHAGLLWGTLAYASPEQFRGGEPIDPRSDLYSFGCILYEMLTGTHPLGPAHVSPREWMHAHLGRSPQPFPHELRIPLLVQQLVIRCLEKEPEERFDSVMDLDSALQMAQQNLAMSAASPSAPVPLHKTRSLWWPWVCAALIPFGIWIGVRGLQQSSPLVTEPPDSGQMTTSGPDSNPDLDQHTQPLLLRGVILLQKGDVVRAAVLFQEAVDLDPQNGRALAGLGIALSQLQRLEQAEHAVQAALELEPGDSFVRTARGVYLAQQREWEEARAEFELAVHLNPNNYLAQAALNDLQVSLPSDDAVE